MVIEGNDSPDLIESKEWWEPLSIEEHVNELMERNNLTSKEAIKEVSIARNVSKREIYQAYHV